MVLVFRCIGAEKGCSTCVLANAHDQMAVEEIAVPLPRDAPLAICT